MEDLGLAPIIIGAFTGFAIAAMKESVYANRALKDPDESETAKQITRFRQEFQHNWDFSILKYPKTETIGLCRQVATMAQTIVAKGQGTRAELASSWQAQVVPFENKLLRWVSRFHDAETAVSVAIPVDAYLQTTFVSADNLPRIRDNVIEFCLDARAYLAVLEYATANDSHYQVKEYFAGWLDIIVDLFHNLGNVVIALLEALRAAVNFLNNLVRALPSALPWILGGGALLVGGLTLQRLFWRHKHRYY